LTDGAFRILSVLDARGESKSRGIRIPNWGTNLQSLSSYILTSLRQAAPIENENAKSQSHWMKRQANANVTVHLQSVGFCVTGRL
jgi:hypothetical protein